MNQLTLRKIPPTLEKQLRIQARKSGMSLNKAAVSFLARGLGVKEPLRTKRKRDLSRFAGTMTKGDLEEFQANTAFFSRIDPEAWKS